MHCSNWLATDTSMNQTIIWNTSTTAYGYIYGPNDLIFSLPDQILSEDESSEFDGKILLAHISLTSRICQESSLEG